MILDVVWVTVPGFMLGALFMALANRRVTVTVARGRWLKFLVFGLIVHTVLAAAALGRVAVILLIALILVAATIELAGAWRRIPAPRPVVLWPVFIAVVVVVLWQVSRLPPPAFAFLFLVVATCDGFSQVVGQWLGRRQLVPRLSPGKTVAGFAGGLVAAVVVAVLIRGLLPAGPAAAAMVGVATALAGLGGDLCASWVKRRAGLKDYSAALPGQGGFLDRFDSLLGAIVVAGSIVAAQAGQV